LRKLLSFRPASLPVSSSFFVIRFMSPLCFPATRSSAFLATKSR